MPVAQVATANKAESTQMNIRIGVELKAQGDAVFAHLGLTASQAVRKLYELAASCASNPDKLKRVLLGTEEDNIDECQQRIVEKLELVELGAGLFDAALAQAGITQSSLSFKEFINQPYADLREAALLDEYGEGEEK